MRVAFFGLPLAALLLLHDGVEIVLAALSRKGAIGTRRLTKALGEERLFDPASVARPGFVDLLRRAQPDLLVSWFWTKRLARDVLAVPPRGAIGAHPSLLPRHRGPDPYFWAIERGDAVTGVTVHRLDEEYDTGAILARREIALEPSWSSWILARRLDRPSLALLRETVRAFAEGRPPQEVPQDDARATPAPEPDDDLLVLRWDTAAEALARRVRAASPWPGAQTQIGDAWVTLTRAAVTHDFPRALAPGEAAVRADGVAVVRAKDLALELREGRDEDDAALHEPDFAKLVGESRTA